MSYSEPSRIPGSSRLKLIVNLLILIHTDEFDDIRVRYMNHDAVKYAQEILAKELEAQSA